MLGVKGLNYNVGPLRIISATESHTQVKMKFISSRILIIFLIIKMALCPWSMTFITCLSKCRIGDVSEHSFFKFSPSF